MKGRIPGVATWIVLHVEVLLSPSDSSLGSIGLGEDGESHIGLESPTICWTSRQFGDLLKGELL